MLLYWIWFAELSDITLWQKHILLEHFNDPEELYHARREAFLEIPDMTESILKALEEKDLTGAKRILRACAKTAIRASIKSLPNVRSPKRRRSWSRRPSISEFRTVSAFFSLRRRFSTA